MDHNLAIKNNTAERYLLGELNEAEIEEYEDHFFSCQACAQEVQLGSEFIADVREVFKTEFKAEPKRTTTTTTIATSTIWGRFWNSMRHPAPAFACAALVVVSGFSIYQNSVIGELRQDVRTPQVLASTSVTLQEPRRGETGKVLVSIKRNEGFRLEFDIPPKGFSFYDLDLLDASGARRFSSRVSAQDANDSIQLYFPAKTLDHPGQYLLVIKGVNSDGKESTAIPEVARYSFELVFQK